MGKLSSSNWLRQTHLPSFQDLLRDRIICECLRSFCDATDHQRKCLNTDQRPKFAEFDPIFAGFCRYHPQFLQVECWTAMPQGISVHHCPRHRLRLPIGVLFPQPAPAWVWSSDQEGDENSAVLAEIVIVWCITTYWLLFSGEIHQRKGKGNMCFFLGGWSFKQIRIHHVWAWAMAIESLVVHSKDKTIGNASISRISGRMGDGLSLGSLTIATAHLGCGLCMALLHCCPWIHSKRDFFLQCNTLTNL